ncbi:hypothetical protein L917_06286 [Phytophthora nicotianae]|uniref:Uncharacterized protein n=1 Tax=Phytophthora nicotianae TaxID=4792 RepID=W2LHG0_PHYNI|nr:hypothetical protein L917_06286 [Phytophthora nicotianae]
MMDSAKRRRLAKTSKCCRWTENLEDRVRQRRVVPVCVWTPKRRHHNLRYGDYADNATSLLVGRGSSSLNAQVYRKTYHY